MITFLYVLQFVVAILLILFVMFQKSEGGTNLISSNQYNSFFSSKAMVANPLTKFTIILGILFFVNSIVIGWYHISSTKNQSSIADKIEEISVEKNNNKANNDANKSSNNSVVSEVPLGK